MGIRNNAYGRPVESTLFWKRMLSVILSVVAVMFVFFLVYRVVVYVVVSRASACVEDIVISGNQVMTIVGDPGGVTVENAAAARDRAGEASARLSDESSCESDTLIGFFPEIQDRVADVRTSAQRYMHVVESVCSDVVEGKDTWNRQEEVYSLHDEYLMSIDSFQDTVDMYGSSDFPVLQNP